MAEPVLRCNDCKMTFKSRTLLAKHKGKFCVGGSIGDPHQLMLRRGLRSADEHEKWKKDLEDRPQSDSQLNAAKIQSLRQERLKQKIREQELKRQLQITTKVRELQDLKDRRTKQRNLRDLEEKILLDDLNTLDKGTSPRVNGRNSDDEVRELQREYARLREQEAVVQAEMRRLEVGMYDNIRSDQENTNRLDLMSRNTNLLSRSTNRSGVFSRNTNSSMSLDLSRVNSPSNWRNSHNRQVRLLAEDHGEQLADIKSRNKDLERQKEDIRRRLEELGRKTHIRPTEQDATQKLLAELKAQEQRNQATLQELKKQLGELSKRGRQTKSEKGLVNLPYYGNSLVAEIGAMRQAYLQSGGNDPSVLAQMADMQAEAQALETQQNKNGHSKRPKSKDKQVDSLTEQLLAFELENQRLQRELLLLQQQNVSQKKKATANDSEDEFDRDIKQLQKDHLRKMTKLQQEMELYKQQAMLEKFKRDIGSDVPVPKRQNYSPPPSVGPKYEVPVKLPQSYSGHRGYHEEAEVPALLQPKMSHHNQRLNVTDSDPLMPAPYDPQAGFAVFYDYILGLDPSIKSCRLVVGLYNMNSEMGEASVLPTVYCEPTQGSYYQQSGNTCVIGAKQPVPSCHPAIDLGIVCEMQGSGGPGSHHDSRKLVSRAWVKMDLFDEAHRVVSGRWKVPLRVLPVRPQLATADLNAIPQYGSAELYYRIVNARDANSQSMVTITTQNSHLYRYPPQLGPFPSSHHLLSSKSLSISQPQLHQASRPQLLQPSNSFNNIVLPPPSTSPPQSPAESRYQPRSPSHRELLTPGESKTLGFQVDRVKYAEPGEGKVRLVAYYMKSAKIVQSASSPVSCSTTSVRSNFKHRYHVFGQQEAMFQGVSVQPDMALIVRFYSGQQGRPESQQSIMTIGDIGTEENLVAWGVLPLVVPDRLAPGKMRSFTNIGSSRINIGTHVVPLYEAPVPEANRIPVGDITRMKQFRRYQRKASVRLHVFHGKPRPGSLTPSEASEEGEILMPEHAWIPLPRETPPSESYNPAHGFDLYVDGCRNLPDSVTYSRVAGRILSREYEKIGKDIKTGVELDSDIYNPVYDYRQEYREPNIPPTATLMLKVYTMDRFNRELTVVGYAALAVFVESGSERQPQSDQPGVQVSLNEGGHQVRLYSAAPDGAEPATEDCLGGNPIVPCATILVRIVRAPVGPQGKPLESEKIPQSDWIRLGLWVPRPDYSSRVYYSMKCNPTESERGIFSSYARRDFITMRDGVVRMSTEDERLALQSDEAFERYIATNLEKVPGENPEDMDLSFITPYSPTHGIKVAIDNCQNLPWSNFTHVMYCLNPPGSFYKGQPNAVYDKPCFTSTLNLDSTNKSPFWTDEFTHFRNRSYHRYLTLVIHVQEIAVSVSRDNYKYGLQEQAWTAIQIFNDKYVNHSCFQLPLFHGAPTQKMLYQLEREPFLQWLVKNVKGRTVKLVPAASIFIRLCDARRSEEIPETLYEQEGQINIDYIPPDRFPAYTEVTNGRPLKSMVPEGRSFQNFSQNLSSKFKSLVYKLYEEEAR